MAKSLLTPPRLIKKIVFLIHLVRNNSCSKSVFCFPLLCIDVSRQCYQSLLERIPRCLKALHTEAVAQRVLNRRLAEEIGRIRTSFQQLSTYVGQQSGCRHEKKGIWVKHFYGPLCRALSRIREHDDLVSHQAEEAHQQLTGALEQAQTNSESVRPTPLFKHDKHYFFL